MRRFRLIGLIASVATAGALIAAPVFAAASVQVPLTFDATTLQVPGTDLTSGGTVKTPALNPCRQGGGTFADTSVNGTGFPAGKDFTPQGSPVSFMMPSSATGNNALCLGLGGSGAGAVTGKDSTTINVPAGKYTDAYFLAAVGNGPTLTDVTPMYGSTAGKTIQTVFPDWCTGSTKVAGTLPPNVTAGWNGGDRVNYDGTTQAGLNCGYYTLHVAGLDGTQQLTALKLTLEPAKTAIPDSMSGGKGKTNDPGATLDIAALTLAGAAAAGATMPKTGGNETGILFGAALVLAGAALAFRPRLLRGAR